MLLVGWLRATHASCAHFSPVVIAAASHRPAYRLTSATPHTMQHWRRRPDGKLWHHQCNLHRHWRPVHLWWVCALPACQHGTASQCALLAPAGWKSQTCACCCCALAGSEIPPLITELVSLVATGANDTVQLDLRGVSNAFVQPAQPTTTITGSAQGINVVQVNRSWGGGRVGRGGV